MCDNHLESIKQCETPLNTLFFSDFNKKSSPAWEFVRRLKIRLVFRLITKTQMTFMVSCVSVFITTRVIITPR